MWGDHVHCDSFDQLGTSAVQRHKDYRSNRELLTMSCVFSSLGLAVGITWDVLNYTIPLLLLMTAVGCVMSSLGWLAWKRWGRPMFPLRAQPPVE